VSTVINNLWQLSIYPTGGTKFTFFLTDGCLRKTRSILAVTSYIPTFHFSFTGKNDNLCTFAFPLSSFYGEKSFI